MLLSALSILSSAYLTHSLAFPDGARSVASDGGNTTTLEWGPCDPKLVQNPSVACSLFDIPLDYHNIAAGFGRLAVAKVNATGDRLGTLFMNPGGPGESGLIGLSELAPLLQIVTGGRYDIVSWDTRGVGPHTIPGDIDCFDSLEEFTDFWNGTVQLTGIEMTRSFSDPADVHALLAQAPIMQQKYEEVARRCLDSSSGKYLQYVGTAATVRDMVALADALDGPGKPVNYYGFSYGTVVGSWFMNMFPERVGRVIIDGIVDTLILATEETTTLGYKSELTDSDEVYRGFVTGCALAGPEGCAIASPNATAADVDAAIQALLQRAHDAARANASVPVTSAGIRTVLFNPTMYAPALWANFSNVNYTEAVAAVQQETQNGTFTNAPVRRRLSRRDITTDPLSFSLQAIACSDSVDPRGTKMLDIFNEVINVTKTSSHMFGSLWPVGFSACPLWPFRAVERYQGPFNKTLANKVLVLSNTLDPITPLSAAQAVANAEGSNARLVRLAGFGHATIGSPSKCINEVKQAYFINGTIPEDNETLCQTDSTFEVFEGVTTEDILAAMASAD